MYSKKHESSCVQTQQFRFLLNVHHISSFSPVTGGNTLGSYSRLLSTMKTILVIQAVSYREMLIFLNRSLLPFMLDKIKVCWETGSAKVRWSSTVLKKQASFTATINSYQTNEYSTFRKHANELSNVGRIPSFTRVCTPVAATWVPWCRLWKMLVHIWGSARPKWRLKREWRFTCWTPRRPATGWIC